MRSLKKWFNRLRNYTRQNDEFLTFFEGGDYETWTCRRDSVTYGISIQARAAVVGPPAVVEITVAAARQKTQSLTHDLEALLLIFAEYVPLGYYDMILE